MLAPVNSCYQTLMFLIRILQLSIFKIFRFGKERGLFLIRNLYLSSFEAMVEISFCSLSVASIVIGPINSCYQTLMFLIRIL